MCLHIYMCVWREATRAVGAEWGFMMKFSGNLKSTIIEPESGKKMERGGRKSGNRKKKAGETEQTEG